MKLINKIIRKMVALSVIFILVAAGSYVLSTIDFSSMPNFLDLGRVLEIFAVLFTTYFTFRTLKYAKETITLEREREAPSVVVFVKQREESLNVLDLVIKNEGHTSARDIKFTVENPIDIITKRKITDISLIKNGLTLIAGKEEIKQPLTVSLGDDYNKLRASNCTIKVKYKDEKGRIYKDSFLLDFTGLVDRKIGSKPAYELVSVLKDIRKSHKKIENYLQSIKTKGFHEMQWEYGNNNKTFTESEKLGE